MDMTSQTAYPGNEFRRLRMAYEHAFHSFSSQVRLFQSLTVSTCSDRAALEAARQRVELAQTDYRSRRDMLARFMLTRQENLVSSL